MTAIKIGDFKKRITIQQRSTSVDPLGQPSLAWVNVATVWADINPLSGRELIAAKAVNSELTHSVLIRYQVLFADPIAVSKMRVLYGTRIFNIQASIDQDERHRIIELSCAEGLVYG